MSEYGEEIVVDIDDQEVAFEVEVGGSSPCNSMHEQIVYGYEIPDVYPVCRASNKLAQRPRAMLHGGLASPELVSRLRFVGEISPTMQFQLAGSPFYEDQQMSNRREHIYDEHHNQLDDLCGEDDEDVNDFPPLEPVHPFPAEPYSFPDEEYTEDTESRASQELAMEPRTSKQRVYRIKRGGRRKTPLPYPNDGDDSEYVFRTQTHQVVRDEPFYVSRDLRYADENPEEMAGRRQEEQFILGKLSKEVDALKKDNARLKKDYEAGRQRLEKLTAATAESRAKLEEENDRRKELLLEINRLKDLKKQLLMS